MRINFGDFDTIMGVYDCILEVNQGDKTTKQHMQAPRFMIEQQFASLVNQAAGVKQPIKVKISRTEPIWNEFEQKQTDVEYSAAFMNNAWCERHDVKV